MQIENRSQLNAERLEVLKLSRVFFADAHREGNYHIDRYDDKFKPQLMLKSLGIFI